MLKEVGFSAPSPIAMEGSLQSPIREEEAMGIFVSWISSRDCYAHAFNHEIEVFLQ
jgi:hypothetical protein